MAKDVWVQVLELSDILNRIIQAQATASNLVGDTVVLTQLVSKCRLHKEPPSWAKECLNSKKIKKDLEAAKRLKQEKPNESELEIKFKGN